VKVKRNGNGLYVAAVDDKVSVGAEDRISLNILLVMSFLGALLQQTKIASNFPIQPCYECGRKQRLLLVWILMYPCLNNGTTYSFASLLWLLLFVIFVIEHEI